MLDVSQRRRMIAGSLGSDHAGRQPQYQSRELAGPGVHGPGSPETSIHASANWAASETSSFA
jgi:hypothetical protein